MDSITTISPLFKAKGKYFIFPRLLKPSFMLVQLFFSISCFDTVAELIFLICETTEINLI